MDLKNIEELLTPKLGPNKNITNVEITKPPAKGAGSVMLKVKVTVRDKDNKEQLIHLVAKTIPESEELRKHFNIQHTFKKEVAFYRVILPIVRNFLKEEKVTDVLDNFAKFYEARYNLEGNSEEVDENGVMLLEDLSVKGFANGTHDVGFNFSAAEGILQDLAKFHGTIIALKLKKPDIFQSEIRPQCSPFDFTQEGLMAKALKVLRELIKTFPDCGDLAEKATNFQRKETPKTCREPFGTIIHFDLWVNNIMTKIDNGGRVHNVFVDFQLYDYRSAASDVFFFLWTSIEKTVLKQNLDHFLHYYHHHLIYTLKSFSIDTSAFEYEVFEEELHLIADFEFGHALVFKFLLTFFKKLGNVNRDLEFTVDQISPELKDFTHFMVSECAKRGWLY